MNKILLSLSLICLCSGCASPTNRLVGAAIVSPTTAVADATGRVIWAGVMAGAPNQQSDYAEQQGWNHNEWLLQAE